MSLHPPRTRRLAAVRASKPHCCEGPRFTLQFSEGIFLSEAASKWAILVPWVPRELISAQLVVYSHY